MNFSLIFKKTIQKLHLMKIYLKIKNRDLKNKNNFQQKLKRIVEYLKYLKIKNLKLLIIKNCLIIKEINHFKLMKEIIV